MHLPDEDLGLKRLEEDWDRYQSKGQLPKETKNVAATTLHAANEAQEEERARLHSFTQILICSIVIMLLIAVAFVIWASIDSELAQLFCFQDQEFPQVLNCPIGSSPEGSDVFLIEFIGMFAAALAGAISLRGMKGTASPYHISVLLLVLRLPVGAMAAVLGILLISGEFLPGLTHLDTGAQIVAWAAAFGILQEPVTRTVDRQGRQMLSNALPPEDPEILENGESPQAAAHGSSPSSQKNRPARLRARKRRRFGARAGQ